MVGAGPAPITTNHPFSRLLARKKAALPRQDSEHDNGASSIVRPGRHPKNNAIMNIAVAFQLPIYRGRSGPMIDPSHLSWVRRYGTVQSIDNLVYEAKRSWRKILGAIAPRIFAAGTNEPACRSSMGCTGRRAGGRRRGNRGWRNGRGDRTAPATAQLSPYPDGVSDRSRL
jgi:hypothetical protein